MTKSSLSFVYRLPDSRLGTKHDTLESFDRATGKSRRSIRQSNEYSLVVVTEIPFEAKFGQSTKEPETTNIQCKSERQNISMRGSTRILLDTSNRGCGRDSYNLVGGKFLDELDTPEECACRELEKTANLKVSIDEMLKSKVGIQRCTVENDETEMVIHVFRINFEAYTIQYGSDNVTGCKEIIIPLWFDDFTKIPFDKMFADHSLWLTILLSSPVPIKVNGSYHFQENRQERNTILHHHVNVQDMQTRFSMEQRLFHKLHANHYNALSIKEFKECHAFCSTVRRSFRKTVGKKDSFHTVIDVCGGHGALGALFLIYTNACDAIIIDPADVGGRKIYHAWGEFIDKGKTLTFRRECLRTGLPKELERALQITNRHRILVVACHACQHLSEEVLEIACDYGVHVSVMPCCQKDHTQGSMWKSASNNMSISVAKVMDILQCGKLMAQGTHEVRMKCIDSKITPQNRIIVCTALDERQIIESRYQRQIKVDKAHSRLQMVYKKAHTAHTVDEKPMNRKTSHNVSPLCYIATGFLLGILTTASLRKR